ncbi:F-box/LRR-repeat protein At3g26922 isoform X2 [Daucus carota subsp. sativus]|nr:PREDICTED: F-box/LRR-repeat protein At3g26922-like isoform X2 [Daucus carota subsp. sativus]
MMSDVKNGQINCGGNAAAPLSKRQFRDEREDRISYLPEELITRIFDRLPIHDVARTSILSRAWRNFWPEYPVVALDREFNSRLTSSKEITTHKSEFIKAFKMIISSHTGPIQKFNLYTTPVLRHWSIHQGIIRQLSGKGVKEIYLYFEKLEVYPLSPALFDCHKLTRLFLHHCIVGPSIDTRSFTNLTEVLLSAISFPRDMTFGTQLQVLYLRNCIGIEHLTPQFISGNHLRRLFIVTSTTIEWKWFQSTTKLKFLGLALKASNSNIKGASKLIELLSKIPHFSNLSLDGTTLEVFGPPPPDLARPATKAIELRISTLTVFRLKMHNFCQILNLVYIIRSCPNLEDICIMLALERVKSSTPEESTIDNYFASLDSKDMCLDQLQTVKIKGIQYSRFVQNFIKLLLASSPSLKVISLSCNTKITSLEDKLKIKRDLRKIHRLSLDAQVIWC